MKVDQIRQLVDQVEFGDYAFAVSEAHGSIYLQATYDEADIVTGVVEKQHTRKWLLSPAMTKSEIVQTCFKLALTSAEHIVREEFKYRGRRIFGPHFDVDALHRICGDREFDVRPATDPAPGCDCANPDGEGVAHVSNECPVHNLNPRPAPGDETARPTDARERA